MANWSNFSGLGVLWPDEFLKSVDKQSAEVSLRWPPARIAAASEPRPAQGKPGLAASEVAACAAGHAGLTTETPPPEAEAWRHPRQPHGQEDQARWTR